jgi:hypothetical protein
MPGEQTDEALHMIVGQNSVIIRKLLTSVEVVEGLLPSFMKIHVYVLVNRIGSGSEFRILI